MVKLNLIPNTAAAQVTMARALQQLKQLEKQAETIQFKQTVLQYAIQQLSNQTI
jgi:hypothetical protein